MVYYSINSVFLTGATGVLGSYILKDLLRHSDCDIYCLVRSENSELALRRLYAMFEVYDSSGKLLTEFLTRVKPVLGDVTLPKFGLSDNDYEKLAQRVEVTIHGAAYTNLFSRITKIEPINVGGTINVVDFVLKTAQKRLTYISTYTVMGDKAFDPTVTFTESDLDIGQKFDHMSYQQTKFIAEKYIRAATDKGLIWNIVRPGQIFGDSQTGAYPQGQTSVSGLFYDIFKTVIETGVAIDSSTYYFDVTPVDYVSRATLYLTLEEKTSFHTLHLVNPDYKSYTSIIRIIRDLGYNINFVSIEDYKRLVFDRELTVDGNAYKSATIAAFRWWFKREGIDFTASCHICCQKTLKMLVPKGVLCPPLDSALLGTYIDRGINLNYFPAVPKLMEVYAR